MISEIQGSAMPTVAVVGLGYVGIPLAVEFGKILNTIGFDISASKVEMLKRHVLPGDEISISELSLAKHLQFTDSPSELSSADYIIVAVPTLVTESHHPDFGPLIEASKLIGRHMKSGATIVYESTVYPGATEELCIPALESTSGMTWRKDFHVGYSPERVNPGDPVHTLPNIVKIVSGDDAKTLESISLLYKRIIKAGVYCASSIKVAEAAKVIENTQRDANIALMNEVSIICHLVNIDTSEVIEAASTKWNFIQAHPGLVGGHCISVVPYYLESKAEQLGYHPLVISAARKTNEAMAVFIADQVISQLTSAGLKPSESKVNILGLSFKENVKDISNSKIIDVIEALKRQGVMVSLYDPMVSSEAAKQRYGITLLDWDLLPVADAIIIAIPHHQFISRPLAELASKLVPGGSFFDLHGSFDAHELKKNGFNVWRL